MPGSSNKGKKEIKDWFKNRTDIKTIVDIGPGWGTYPKLLGDKYKWTAVEIYKPYINEYKLKDLYSEIIIGDICKIKLPKADCIILGDVMEHIEKKLVRELFYKIDKKYKHVVISIPVNYPQKSSHGNIYETHLSIWEYYELDDLIPLKTYKIREFINPIAVFIK